MTTFRKLKIHRKFLTRRWDNITIPEIRLEGKWLEDAGFKQGAYVTIHVKKNRLTITMDKGDQVNT
ncbi:type I toxin-antitoxin system SymE family toxin [Sphingobacterium sp. lm-10]|uniref:SymE family type I addiction module toxin n=1 Tax=Sphingobacterium sp. lm-10 TaxID=2944904 RepID=UPI00201FE0AE|nr:SymE family type I addiction module toxin [Sphingobacterium sp. lm-10]MCL7988750.1 type I toxin-antitoxin system SymE family toxin [Sphingobacterium sp. lm-10]